MNISSDVPNENIAATVASSMTREKVLSADRMATGDQHFIFAIKTENSEYVIRMTDLNQKNKFISAIYWQEKLLSLGIPLAKFIQSDLNGNYSKFPALLMMRLPGNDLCNIYSNLTNSDKRNLAEEMIKIQALTNALPDGLGYGITDSYEQISVDKSWYDFLVNRLNLFMEHIKQNAVFDANEITKVILIAKNMEEEFRVIRARPFLWDASERNVIVHQGKISGIVDVDEICFGDPLFVIALTYVALKVDGYDTLYTDYWEEILKLDKQAQCRLEFYKLFYTVVFMRKHSMTSANKQKIIFDIHRLENMFRQSLARVMEKINE